MNKPDINMIVGALDSLGVALAEHGHQWTEGERAIYEESVKTLWNEFEKFRQEVFRLRDFGSEVVDDLTSEIINKRIDEAVLAGRITPEIREWQSKRRQGFVRGEKCPRCMGTGIIGETE